jgi:hypothetical protein
MRLTPGYPESTYCQERFPTDAAHPRHQAQPPRTYVVAPTPAANPRRTCAPRMQTRPEHTRPRVYPVGPRKQGFLHMAAVRARLRQ